MREKSRKTCWLTISSKIFRAVCGHAEGGSQTDNPVRTDFNGSAKIALIGTEESRQAWAVLMEAGKGPPFPQAMEFVRPGFDEPDVAAGPLTRRAPFELRPGRGAP